MKQTPHIKLENEIGFAKTVLMPGDPLRAKYIAENFLENPVLVNSVRGILGYTGMYKGIPVSVMASGMGIPSIGIYAYELFSFFGVEQIIRIGTAGAISKGLKLRDIVIGMGACTNSNFESQYSLPGSFAPIADYSLLCTSKQIADESHLNAHVGNIFSSDTFYDDTNSTLSWEKMGVMAVEMEAAGLYMTAARLQKKALAIVTISDLLFDASQVMTSEERQESLNEMITLALETAIKTY